MVPNAILLQIYPCFSQILVKCSFLLSDKVFLFHKKLVWLSQSLFIKILTRKCAGFLWHLKWHLTQNRLISSTSENKLCEFTSSGHFFHVNDYVFIMLHKVFYSFLLVCQQILFFAFRHHLHLFHRVNVTSFVCTSCGKPE